MTIVLCGFMGCGKTTVGKIIAAELKMKFVDMDDYIEQKQGRKIKDIFSENGEDFFRDIEHEACKNLADAENTVIAAGGGALTFKRNVDAFKNKAKIVFIDTDFDTIKRRIGGDKNRPLMNDGAKELFEKRYPLYKAAADETITAYGDVTPNEMAEKIIESYIR